MRWSAAALLIALLAPTAASAGEAAAPARLSASGRFLYANDDDWDWASPKGRQTSRLSEYGAMDWSAMDWIEEGLTEVRVLAVGSLCTSHLAPGGTLDAARGRQGAHPAAECAPFSPGLLADRLRPEAPEGPNVVLMMRDGCNDPAPCLSDMDLEALVAFTARGGRVIVLDDWGALRAVLGRMLAGRPAAASAPVPESLRRRVLEILPRLGADDYAAREQASKDLVALGLEALPAIRQAQSADPEICLRIELAVETLTVRGAAEAVSGSSPANGDFDGFLKRARESCPAAEVRALKRNATQEPGCALLMSFPAPQR